MTHYVSNLTLNPTLTHHHHFRSQSKAEHPRMYAFSSLVFFCCDLDLDPMNLTYELDLARQK